MELKRMQRVILEKKGLRKDELEKQREPILRLRQEAKRKKQRLQETLQARDDIFQHTIAAFFPESQPERKRVSLTPAMSLAPRKSILKDTLAETILKQEVEVLVEKIYFM